MTDNKIEDKRTINDFKNITFSGYKKSEAKKELIKSILASKVEDSCYWCAEFICAGQYLYLWEIILLFISKHVHIGNPKLPIYIDLRLNKFKEILNSGYTQNLLTMRNSLEIRQLFGEIICVLCYSRKKNAFSIPKIKTEDFDFFNLTNKLKAKNKNLGLSVIKNDDPNEILIAVNEFAWNIHYTILDSFNAYYWIEWILEYDKLCKKKKIKKECITREVPVDFKYKKEMIWSFWECLLNEAERRNTGVKKIIESLLNLYTLKYKPGSKHKRKLLIYYAVSLLTENPNLNTKIINNNDKIEKLKQKINIIYGEIKKSEIQPKANYLFNNSITKTKNLEKSLNKLNKFDNVMFIPRK